MPRRNIRRRLFSTDDFPVKPSRGFVLRMWDVTGHLRPSGSSPYRKSTYGLSSVRSVYFSLNARHSARVGATATGTPSDQRPLILAFRSSDASSWDILLTR